MSSGLGPRMLDAAATAGVLSPHAAVSAIRDALAAGLDPAADPPRQSVPVPGGELLIMPSRLPGAVGSKVLTVAEHPTGELPRIQGQYLLFDGQTLTPRLVLDGAALTRVRTPAVSLAPFAPRLAALDGPVTAAIFGTGPQALAHSETLRDVLSPDVTLGVTYISRTPPRQRPPHWAPADSAEARAAIEAAQVVICATTAREPILDRAWVRDDAVVIAVGSHSPTARELTSALMADADVIVEDRATALRECGDVVLAIDDDALDEADLIPMREVVLGRQVSATRPTVFKTAGMSWQDLVIAQAISRALPA